MIDLNTAAQASHAPTLGAGAEISNTGSAALDLVKPLGETVRYLLSKRMSCATIAGDGPRTELGLMFLVFNGEAMSVFGPSLLAICCRRSQATPSLSGSMKATEETSVLEIFRWVDEAGPRCANGWMQVMIGERAFRFHVFTFTGPAALEAKAVLKNLGCEIGK